MSLPHPAGTSAAYTSPAGDFVLYQGDCLDLMARMPESSVDMIFADPPYFLSNGGITCKSGKRAAVHKGAWDQSKGFTENYAFTKQWIAGCQRLLTPDGTLWISGTSHIIHTAGFCLEELGFRILNDITWLKPNPPPNLSCRCFTHATETILWAARSKKSKYVFNYADMKAENGGKQMTSVWRFTAPGRDEKTFGKHPTQKPLALLERIILAGSRPSAVILDPFSGSATTGIAAVRHGRNYIGIERDSAYIALSRNRYRAEAPETDARKSCPAGSFVPEPDA